MTKPEQAIANYLVGVACEECGEIINNNYCSGLQTKKLWMTRQYKKLLKRKVDTK